MILFTLVFIRCIRSLNTLVRRTAPKIYKLGSNAWKVLKQKTKARVKHVAFNLIQLYAKKIRQRFRLQTVTCKTNWKVRLYMKIHRTKLNQEVKADMERPTNGSLGVRWCGICKTEVAIQAAFKAVDNSKQVAILVPTTILAYQHYRTLRSGWKTCLFLLVI
jgi:transcription-repair coupling factor (superfamily II helicase)